MTYRTHITPPFVSNEGYLPFVRMSSIKNSLSGKRNIYALSFRKNRFTPATKPLRPSGYGNIRRRLV